MRWSEAAADIRSLRRIAKDGPLSIPESDQLLVAASLSQAAVKSDDQGNTRLVKRTRNNTARDDVAAALLLAAGAFDRAGAVAPAKLSPTLRSDSAPPPRSVSHHPSHAPGAKWCPTATLPRSVALRRLHYVIHV